MGSIINREKAESSDSTSPHKPKGVCKAIGALAVILPVTGSLLGVVTTYIKDSREESDQNFREVTEKLVLGSDVESLAAATSTGTFIKEGFFGRMTITMKRSIYS